MRKLEILFVFLCISTETFASPARFGGFSYKRDELGRVALDDATQAFNEGPTQLSEEPQQPYYLEEEDIPVEHSDKYKLIYTIEDVYSEIEASEKKANINYTPQEEKYKTPPVYSMKDLREKKNNISDDDEETDDEE